MFGLSSRFTFRPVESPSRTQTHDAAEQAQSSHLLKLPKNHFAWGQKGLPGLHCLMVNLEADMHVSSAAFAIY